MQMPQENKNKTENNKGTPCLNLVIFQVKQKLSIHLKITRDLEGSFRQEYYSRELMDGKNLTNTPLWKHSTNWQKK